MRRCLQMIQYCTRRRKSAVKSLGASLRHTRKIKAANEQHCLDYGGSSFSGCETKCLSPQIKRCRSQIGERQAKIPSLMNRTPCICRGYAWRPEQFNPFWKSLHLHTWRSLLHPYRGRASATSRPGTQQDWQFGCAVTLVLCVTEKTGCVH